MRQTLPYRNRVPTLSRLAITVLAIASATAGAGSAAHPDAASAHSMTEQATLLAIGERIYHEGLLASGEPLTALINGDIPVVGTQFSCVSCHQRSGLGSIEGWQVATPVTAATLYETNVRRPAYSDATLAVALRTGIDPAGRPFASAMPAFDLGDIEMRGLIAYLKSLSAERSPGVTAETIHFATAFAADDDASEMLGLLEAFFKDKNSETRLQTRRRDHGPWYRDNRNLPYRKWVLHPWRLEGDSSTWAEQLDRYYDEQPVFAMVSGLSTGSWLPVHEFCETRRIPCILPNVDLPVISDDFYTLYFSRGHHAEAESVAEYLSRDDSVRRVLQLFRPTPSEVASAETFREVLRGTEIAVESLELRPGRRLTRQKLLRAVRRSGADAVVLWLPAEAFDTTGSWSDLDELPPIYLSSTLLYGEVSSIAPEIRERAHLIHPFTLPDELNRRFRRVEIWLEKHNMEVGDRRVLGQTWFACMIIAEGLMHVRYENFFRDFFLESIDHTTKRIIPFSTQYAHPSFGPGQRYLSKGCYIVSLAPASGTTLDAQWVVPRGLSRRTP